MDVEAESMQGLVNGLETRYRYLDPLQRGKEPPNRFIRGAIQPRSQCRRLASAAGTMRAIASESCARAQRIVLTAKAQAPMSLLDRK